MNGYGPALPATGGFGFALVWGISNQNLWVIAFSIIVLLVIAISFIRLIVNERKLAKNSEKELYN
jgi:hypothetical protein